MAGNAWSNVREARRKFLHVSFGMAVILLLYYASLMNYSNGRIYLGFAVATGLLAGLWVMDQKLKKKRVPAVDWLLEVFERPGAPPGYGAFWFGVGTLLLLIYLSEVNQIAAGIFVLSLGDCFASVIGRFGRIRLPYNKSKTLEGVIAFFIVSSFSVIFIGWQGLALAAVASLVESVNFHLDDNLTVPVACVAFFKLFA